MKKFGKIFIFSVLSLFLLAFTASAATIDLTGTIRDFNDTHPDFEYTIADDRGIVETTLGTDGKPVYASATTTTTTNGKECFDQWYRDVAGVNLSTPHTITLDNTITTDPAVYTYANSSFFPIDGELLGNQNRIHNYHFTYEIHTQFTYQGGEGIEFAFTGDDDLWLFLNDTLVIDLGGVHGAETASVNLDAIASAAGMISGNTYDFDLFFAERHTTESNFRIDTSIELQPTPTPEPATLLLIGLGILGLACLRRKE